MKRTWIIVLGLLAVSLLVVGYNEVKQKTSPLDENLGVDSVVGTGIQEVQDNCGLTVTSPLPGSIVGHTFTVTGSLDMNAKAVCRWTVFEGQSGVIEVRNQAGVLVTQPIPMTLPDTWMDTAIAGGVIQFSIPVTVPINVQGPISLMMIEDDPSGESAVINTLMISVVVQ